MKKMSKIMEELGFRPEGSNEVKKAFIKNLIRQANLQDPSLQRLKETKKTLVSEEQLSFFDKKSS